MLDANTIRLRACRKRANLDQVELARLLGTSFLHISRFERGIQFPDATVLIAYEIVFGLPPTTLLPDTNLRQRRCVLERAQQIAKRLSHASPDKVDAKMRFLDELIERLDPSS